MSGNMRYSPAAAGQLAFAGTPFSGWEGSTLSFSLSRNLGASGTIAVDWSMTVSEGAPTPSNGTISWNNGEAGIKTVQVQAGIVSADRVGTITLSNPRSLSGGQAPSLSATTQSFTIQNDTTVPSQPTLGAPTGVTSTGMTIPLAFASADAQSGIQDHALERAQGSGSTDFAQVAQGASIFPYPASALTPSTLYRWRSRGRNRAGLYSIYSNIVEGTTGSGGVDNDGLVVSNFANFDPDAASIISVDINNTLSTAFSNGGSVSIANRPWWNGPLVGVARCNPPTTNDGYSGLNNFNFWKNAQKAVRQINIRQEWKASDLFCQDVTGMPKCMIVRTARSLNISAPLQDRPMIYVNHMNEAEGTPTQYRLADVLTFCPAQGTVRMYSTENFIPGVLHSQLNDVTIAGNARFPQPFVVRATPGVDSVGNPIIDADEYLTIEMRVNVMSTADEPNGFIGIRVTRRNGQFIERGIAWTYWPNSDVQVNTNFIADIDVMGGGYFNNGSPFSPERYVDVGRRLTFGFNLAPTFGRHWMNPATDFVQAA